MISYKEVTPEEIVVALAKIEEIKNTSKPNINGRMLWCAANLVFWAGVKASDIPWLKVKNVLAGDNIVNQITERWKIPIKPIPLSDRVKEILMDYIRHLQVNKPELDPDSPLFPEYFGRNAKGAFATDLEEFSLQFDKLQRIGAGNYYRTLIRNGIDPETAEKETATQFRIVEGEGLGGRERNIFYETPKKSVIRAALRREQKEKEEDERAEEQGPREIKLSVSAFKQNAKKREKVIKEGSPRPSAWSFDGRIEEVGNDYVKVGSYPGRKFLVEETTRIIKGEQQISLADLKKGMEVRVRYKIKNREMVAKWIKVL